ncbi:flagellar basal body rod protein FlgC [Stieleria varia]|uniref:Flagellar basal-body rod protein FlgC n=1 Tax=Stieleria varia TaxID=2528005 RepID=A0A5C6AR18_9BACT|nr:flagellar basal body rod protein FlgC [Stieleria varia]TWU02170.1 Flagellar basal-body rod protein FlgC [Stieleria varia]
MSGPFSAIDISASGLAAERMRMEITANNIANAGTTMTETGDPYRRQAVVFSAAMDEIGTANSKEGYHGVQVVGIEGDMTDFPEVYNPGHPHANADGFVRLSNVKIPEEMVDLITASRSYEANTRAISLFKEMVEKTLTLLQGGR